jgi:cephalosporin hydroxylase
MGSPVPVFQHEAELGPLLELYRERRPMSVLELGVYYGGTLWHWLEFARRDVPVTVVAVDTFHEVDNRAAFEAWVPRNVTLQLVEGRSEDPATVAHVAMFAPFEWVFVDADHHDANVRADWANYRPLVSPGGVMAFHDVAPTLDPTVEVEPFWNELRATETTMEFVVGDGRYGIGVVLV